MVVVSYKQKYVHKVLDNSDSICVYVVIISKYATKIVCIQQKQSIFSNLGQIKASSIVKIIKTLEYLSFVHCNASKSQ